MRSSPWYSASRPPEKKKVTWGYFSVSAMRSWVSPRLSMTSPRVLCSATGGKAAGAGMSAA